MNEIEYADTIRAHRTMGGIEVHQKFRKLAIELGLPPDCSKIPKPAKRRTPRWIRERLDQANWEILAQVRMEAHIRLAIPRQHDLSLMRVTGV